MILTAFRVFAGGEPPGFGEPLQGLPPELLHRFAVGQQAFLASKRVEQGLGPVFNRDSCAACHSEPAAGGGSAILETRFGTNTNGLFNPLLSLGGPLIQERGVGAIGSCNISGEVVPPQATIVIQRRTTPTFGFGLVEAVPDQTLLEIAAFQARVMPETAGRPCPNVDLATGRTVIGRFGWKCQDPSMLQFAGDAMNNEAGITNPLFPKENCPQGNCALLACDPVGEPNDDGTFMGQLADFMRLLAPPPRGPITPEVRVGEAVFGRIGCASCHLPTLRTGPNSIAALGRVAFHPYSDFLLHDMGSLNDGFPQGEASGQEMRTAPLWGLRMIATFLHDGRASTITEAILAHDGQGRFARDAFLALRDRDRNALLAFLNSL